MPFVNADFGPSTKPILQHTKGIPAFRPATHTNRNGGSRSSRGTLQQTPPTQAKTRTLGLTRTSAQSEFSGTPLNSDRGSTYTATGFTTLCAGLHIRQSMGRVGSCFDNAAAESFFSTLEWEVLSRHHFRTKDEASQLISHWVDEFYNARRRHSSADMKSPIKFEETSTIKAIAA